MIYQELLRRESEGNPIRVGSGGAGWMGSGFAAQMARVPGMEIVVLADADTGAARAAFLACGIASDDIFGDKMSRAKPWMLLEPESVLSPGIIL